MTDNRPRVLVVDDDTSLLRLMAIRLDAAGYRSLCVESGAAALAALSQASDEMPAFSDARNQFYRLMERHQLDPQHFREI
ncbi:MAG TPA: hypothetical protein EYN73_07420 [Chromatiaceae bacterium]|jgi:two-component system response regulator GlrR|nr:hypothetical protein [Chromatiaceae bacterium]HIA08880.1 hypothetical protein [Chromatiaceae bacterium]HIB85141.1 hypothetical protein [Chromatiaceae bacterium]HIN82528.1 hypothetical protein [Chromatiales bacterium]HIO54549.1 hypothetical protein [Chromatiales bacterium]